MSILSVVRYQLRPEKSAVWEGAVAKIAKRAGEKKDRLHWGCAQVAGGELGAFQIVIPAESFAEAAGRETPAARFRDRIARIGTGARGAAAAELARRLTPGARVTVRGLPRVVRWLRVPEADSVTVEP